MHRPPDHPRAWCATVATPVLLVLSACAPVPAASRTSTPSISANAIVNPTALAPDDCTARAPSAGVQAHSSALSATVTLPAGWSENVGDEGQSGAQSAFALETGSGLNRDVIWANVSTLTVTAHEAAAAEASYTPGSGTVVARGDCNVAGSQAAFFESLIPQLPNSDAYSLYIAHSGKLVRLVILFTTVSRATTMPQVKSILGSWQWDHP